MEEFFENELIKKFEDMVENNDEVYFDTEEYEDIIVYYLEMGDIAFAETAVKFGTKLHPNSPEIKIKKLEVLLELENFSQAKVLINELKDSSMESVDFLVCCAKYYSSLGNPRRAIDFCERALQLEEEENFLHNFIADEYNNLGDPFTALKHYKMALSFDPLDDYSLENIMLCYNQLNKGEEAIEFLDGYLDRYSFSETAWLEYGQHFFNKKNYEEAIRGFDYLLAINPQSVGVYANKAACYEAMGNWQQAVAVYEEMLELEYTKAFTFYKIGLCYREMKNPVAALDAFRKSLREDPQFYLAMIEQSHIYEELGSPQEALHFAKEAVSLNENNLDYQKRLAYLLIDGGHFRESLACLRKLVEMEPGRFYNWYAYAEVLMLLEEYKEAANTIKSGLKLHQRAELYYQLSNCYFQLHNDKMGQESLSEALALDDTMMADMQLKYPSIEEQVKKTKTQKKQ